LILFSFKCSEQYPN